jgi:uncharacterized repeat protein (TIGR03803 family)
MPFYLSRRMLGAIIALVLAAGCGGSESSLGPPADTTSGQGARALSMAERRTGNGYKIIHTFNGQDGAQPRGLVAVDGTLYGVTSSGGAYGGGTAFSLTAKGLEKVLHSFGTGNDGSAPSGALMSFNGILYGVTLHGGTHSSGTVFSLTTSGKERVMHSFAGGSDGAYPSGALIAHGGKLYGTTVYGGANGCSGPSSEGCGTVFSVTPSGDETVVHRFAADGSDGIFPQGTLLEMAGSMYSTAYQAGKNQWGTFYRISDAGKLTVLHNFGPGSSPDAQSPNGGPVTLHGSMYGTAFGGGRYGYGAVYAITTGGAEHVLYSFDIKDGMEPSSSLLALDGRLYGTTYSGGSNGDGNIFELTPQGKIHILYTFPASGAIGSPQSPLITFHGLLYGTAGGGAHDDGVIFTLAP